MVKKFSVEEVPVENNIPLEPLLPQGENCNPQEKSDDSVSQEEQQSPVKKELLPTITITTANGDHLVTKVKQDEGEFSFFSQNDICNVKRLQFIWESFIKGCFFIDHIKIYQQYL